MAKIKIKIFTLSDFLNFSFLFYLKNCFYVSNFPLNGNYWINLKRVCGLKRELRWQK
jgi:hypothetical protein